MIAIFPHSKSQATNVFHKERYALHTEAWSHTYMKIILQLE